MLMGGASMAGGRQGRGSAGAAGGGAAALKVMVAAALIQCAMAVTHIVGGDKGWNFIDYKAWAAQEKSFQVGDTLVFNYSPEVHSVYEVGKESYNSCNLSGPLKTYASGHDTVELHQATTYYFICGVSGHCTSGMAVAIPVTGGITPSTPAPALAPAPKEGPATPPQKLPSPSPSPSLSPSPPIASPSPSPSKMIPSPLSSTPPPAAYTPSSEAPGPSPPKNDALTLRSGAMVVPSILSGILLLFI